MVEMNGALVLQIGMALIAWLFCGWLSTLVWKDLLYHIPRHGVARPPHWSVSILCYIFGPFGCLLGIVLKAMAGF